MKKRHLAHSSSNLKMSNQNKISFFQVTKINKWAPVGINKEDNTKDPRKKQEYVLSCDYYHCISEKDFLKLQTW